MVFPRDVVVLSDEQFGKIVELLTPGYECAKLMLADYQRKVEEIDAPPATDAEIGTEIGTDSGDETH